MKLSEFDFGIGFNNEIVMGEKSKRKGVFKKEPVNVTDEFLKCMVILAAQENPIEYSYKAKNGKKFRIIIEVESLK